MSTDEDREYAEFLRAANLVLNEGQGEDNVFRLPRDRGAEETQGDFLVRAARRDLAESGDHDRVMCLCNLAEVLVENERWDEAREHCLAAIGEDPTVSDVPFFLLADMARKDGKNDQAEDWAREAVAYHPSAQAYELLVKILIDKDQTDLAFDTLMIGLDNITRDYNLLLYQSARIAMRWGENKEALDVARELVEDEPSNELYVSLHQELLLKASVPNIAKLEPSQPSATDTGPDERNSPPDNVVFLCYRIKKGD